MPKNPSPLSRFLSSDKSAAKARAKEASAIAVEGLIASLSVLEVVADAISPPAGSIIKGTASGLRRVADIFKVFHATPISRTFSNMATFQTTIQNIDDIKQLINRVNTLERSIFRPLKGRAVPQSTIQLITNFAE